MARIRTIKPEFWQDEKLSLLDPLSRLVFLGLISMADDQGRLVDNLKLLDGQLFPNTDDSCREPLDTLVRVGRVLRYRAKSGQAVLQIANWSKHQKVDHPSRALLPGPEEAVLADAVVTPAVTPEPRENDATQANDARDNLADTSRESRETLAPRPVPSYLVTKRTSDLVTESLSDHREKRAMVPDTLDDGFAGFWQRYPRRVGGNPKRRALMAWRARRRDGVTLAEMLTGLERYRAYLEHEGKLGTEYVMQAATFLGPDRRYEEAWELPADAGEAELEQRVEGLIAEQEKRDREEAAWLAKRKREMGLAEVAS
jgi:hypothetical protein